jgi:protein-disulfide isomerase
VSAAALFSRGLLLVAAAGAGWLGGQAFRARTAVKERPLSLVPDSTLAAGAGIRFAGPVRPGQPVLRIFGDYECPACQSLDRLAGDSLRALARAGVLAVIYHHAPLRSHRRGPLAAAAAYCGARFGAGPAAHRVLQQTVSEWSRSTDPLPALARVLTGAGVREDSVTACMRDGRTDALVEADRRLGGAFGVNSVPTVVLHDARLEFGSVRALLRHITRAVTRN